MYNNYQLFLQTPIDIDTFDFKSNTTYRGILEHVSVEHGNKYLNLILEEFPVIDFSILNEFCNINDLYGNPKKETFRKDDNILICSPTSLRYIYHALLILDYYQKTKCKNIVEVGCGYGGLCLAINYFMKFFETQINNYHIIDLSEPLNLINHYLNKHNSIIKVDVNYHTSSTYGINIEDKELFFISNYCYTEIAELHNYEYTTKLLSKVDNGFITWQNGGNNGSYPIKNSSKIINKEIVKVIEEKPQTDAGYHIYMNYFVYF
jgi:hypothetical protein